MRPIDEAPIDIQLVYGECQTLTAARKALADNPSYERAVAVQLASKDLIYAMGFTRSTIHVVQ